MFDINEYFKDLEVLVNTDSNSYDPVGLQKVVSEVEKIAKRMGFYVKRHFTSEKSGDYLEISNKKDAERYDVMLMGHLDTVLPPDHSKTCPFRIDDKYAYGPGVGDMKAGALAALYILKGLKKEITDKLAIALIYNCDEEITSPYSRPLTQMMAKKSDYAFVMESHGKRELYTIARKGSGTYKVRFYGKAGHSGYIFDTITANSVVEMAHWITELNKQNNRERLLSVNPAAVSGGNAANVVPEYAELLLNIRVAHKEDYEIFENKMKELLENPVVEGVRAEIEIISKNYPMIPAEGMDEYLERIKNVFRSIGQEFDVYPIRGGCSDGNIIADMGTRCLDSLGPMGTGCHTLSEYIYIDDIKPCIERLTALIEEIASHKE